MDENALLAACLVGDPNAQRIFFDQFSSTMMGIALRYMKDEQLANDVLQETFIKAFENIHKFKNVGSLEGWLKKITVNTALDHLRKEKKFQFTSEIIDSSNELSYGENAVTKLQADDLMRIIQSLPDGYRTVFN
ncbi:MAG: RNA polymerase sigma factor, partial [Crocinitomicaceae bacterium]|nr:RNA polymerase sigma factor [Crocinitomicaceae bacterium]